MRSAYLLYAVLSDPKLRGGVVAGSPELGRVSVEKLRADLADLLPRVASEENDQETAAAATSSAASGFAGGGGAAAPDPAGRRPRSTSSP